MWIFYAIATLSIRYRIAWQHFSKGPPFRGVERILIGFGQFRVEYDHHIDTRGTGTIV